MRQIAENLLDTPGSAIALYNTKRVDRRLLLQRTFLFNRGLMRLTPEILSEVSAPGHADTQKRAFLFSNS